MLGAEPPEVPTSLCSRYLGELQGFPLPQPANTKWPVRWVAPLGEPQASSAFGQGCGLQGLSDRVPVQLAVYAEAPGVLPGLVAVDMAVPPSAVSANRGGGSGGSPTTGHPSHSMSLATPCDHSTGDSTLWFAQPHRKMLLIV